MLTSTMTHMENVWNTFQEPRCPAFLPNSYMLLLSALDKGWKVVKVELTPSWDQHGFIFLVTLAHPANDNFQQLILPHNSLVANLLHEVGTSGTLVRSILNQPA
jgi:hypothetical protein